MTPSARSVYQEDAVRVKGYSHLQAALLTNPHSRSLAADEFALDNGLNGSVGLAEK